MSVLEIKQQLIEKIQSTNDEAILEDFQRFLDLEIDIEPVADLNVSQWKEIDESQNEIQNGDFFTQGEMDKLFAE
jgi:hypothetical protein